MTMAQDASMPMLGDLIEMAETGPALAAALAAAGQAPLIDRINVAAERLGLAPEDFARLAIRRFSERADDEQWVRVMGVAGRDDRPGAALIAAILHTAVNDAETLSS